MKMMPLLAGFCAIIPRSSAQEFSRYAHFASVDAFVSTAKAFQPEVTKSDLTPLFTVRELGQPEDPKTGEPVTASSVESCQLLYKSDEQALVFITANPPVEATKEIVGVLFLLARKDGNWQISDFKRFTAMGMDSGLKSEISGATVAGNLPIVTIQEFQGGRGYSEELSATYNIVSSRLRQIELK